MPRPPRKLALDAAPTSQSHRDRAGVIRRFAAFLQRLAEPAVCSVQIVATGLQVTRGQLPPALHGDLADVVREFGLTRGRIDVVLRSGRLQLRFHPDVPPHCHQRLRNVFGVFLATAPLRQRRRR